MKHIIAVTTIAAMTTLIAPPAANAAGVVEKACRQSDRTAANPQLCACIQQVANQSLNRKERKKVAKWFHDPHAAQKVRQSDRRSDEVLWKRYKAFGERAREVCK